MPSTQITEKREHQIETNNIDSAESLWKLFRELLDKKNPTAHHQYKEKTDPSYDTTAHWTNILLNGLSLLGESDGLIAYPSRWELRSPNITLASNERRRSCNIRFGKEFICDLELWHNKESSKEEEKWWKSECEIFLAVESEWGKYGMNNGFEHHREEVMYDLAKLATVRSNHRLLITSYHRDYNETNNKTLESDIIQLWKNFHHSKNDCGQLFVWIWKACDRIEDPRPDNLKNFPQPMKMITITSEGNIYTSDRKNGSLADRETINVGKNIWNW